MGVASAPAQALSPLNPAKVAMEPEDCPPDIDVSDDSPNSCAK